MGLLSIFKRRGGAGAPAAASEPVDPVQRARVLARQRLIGAAILVIVGIVGFPLVFETQPRPIPVDIPIEIPRKEGAPPLAMPARSTEQPAANAPVTTVAPAASAAADNVLTETRADAGREMVAPPPPKPDTRAQTAKDAKPDLKPAGKPPAAGADPRPQAKSDALHAADAARARELLQGQGAPVAASATGRFVLQVGAFADAASAHETRLRVEKLGLKTYTQVATTAAGNRIRVRVGPFGSRDEADKALAKAKGAGLSAVVLTL